MQISDWAALGVQSVIALAVVCSYIVLVVNGSPIPGEFSGLAGAIFGFYFRTLVQGVNRAANGQGGTVVR